MEFELLADSIKQINDKASSAAKSAVNQLMTLRNWAIGYYIVEYEQDGSDRAEYGSHLLKNLEKQIDQKGMNYTLFKACRQFYKVYPQIGSTVSSEFKLPDFGKSSTVSNEFVTDPDVLVNNLSFSHIREIMVLNDAFERFFYETECMKCNWNVRELRRQIKTNLYVRAGISKKPELLLKKSVDNANGTMLSIKDPFTFEFLGLDARDAVSESDLEQALMDHLQEFMLELGEGFCFEARQKRIIIDDKYYFIDLVFYNRLLHCNVIIELKNDEFKHEDLGTSGGSILWSFANGYDDSPVKLENTHAPIKSVGNSTTTPKDLVCDEDVKIVLYILAESVAARLRENGFRCRVVEISVRDNELFSFTRQKKIDHATNITGEIAAYAYQIFKENYNWSKPIRSVGVRGADLVTDNYWEQIDLFSSVEKREKQMKMDSAVDEIRRRFGFYSIQRGLMYRDRILSAVNAKEEHTVHPHGYFSS